MSTASEMYRKTDSISFENSAASRKRLVLEDTWDGLRLWPVWLALGWSDILQRYRRSLLGPFWLTASMAVMVLSLGLLYGQLFKIAISEFIPFVCVGLIVWGFISSILNEAGSVFTANELFIKQIRLPYTIYVWKFVWSKMIIFAHNFIIYVVILIYFRIWPGEPFIFIIPGLLLIVINGLLVTLYLGMISARFRDVPQIVAAATQVVFFLTPVIWKPELLAGHQYVANWNPLYHVIEIVRSPLLGHWPSPSNVTVTLAVTMLNFAIAALFFPRFRARIAYWV
jgi:lipopolysaccharide transport system permease protein